jgi:sugar phosphate isomerase/epimerase
VTAAQTRREFLSAAAGSIAIASARGTPSRLAIGLGLWTLSEDLAKDWVGTLHKVAAMGYREVELSTLARPDAGIVARSLETCGLRATSCILRPFSPLEAEIDFAKTVGSPCLVQIIPDVDPSRLTGLSPADATKAVLAAIESLTLDDWKANAETLRVKASTVRKAGLRFVYHTHGVDFRRFGHQSALDVTLAGTDPALVELELDCGWAVNAGVDPVALLSRHSDRIKMLHLKEVRPGFTPTWRFEMKTAQMGQGSVDWRRLLRAARNAGVERGFVEDEPPYVEYTALEAAKVAYAYLHALGD